MQELISSPAIEIASKMRLWHGTVFKPQSLALTMRKLIVLAGNSRYRQRDVRHLEYLWLPPSPNQPPTRVDVLWNVPGLPKLDLPLMRVICQEFLLDDERSTKLTWQTGGHTRTVELAAFAAVDTDELRETVVPLLRGLQPTVEKSLQVAGPDEIDHLTFKEVIRFKQRNSGSMLDKALFIRTGSMASQGWGCLAGSETLGTNEIDFTQFGKSTYEKYQNRQDCPIPQAMAHQFDVTILLILKDKQKEILKELMKKIFQKDPKPWYEIYLTVYVLLSNLEYIHGGAIKYMKSQLKTVGRQL